VRVERELLDLEIGNILGQPQTQEKRQNQRHF
jgi:hypothetical protein